MKSKQLKRLMFSSLMILGLGLGVVETKADGEVSNVNSRSSILIENNTGKILHKDNENEKLPIASVSKIITMYKVNEKVAKGGGKWEDIVPISDYLSNISLDGALGGTPLYKDEEYTVLDLYKGMILESSNSATMALGDWISGNQTQYIKDANEWLEKDLGLKDFTYVSASGLENSDIQPYMAEGTDAGDYNEFSAKDVAIISQRLLTDYPNVLEISTKANDNMSNGLGLTSSNSLVKGHSEYDSSLGIDGLKTGYTPLAGKTFVGTGEKDGMRLIAVTLDSDNYASDTKNMLRYGYDNYKKINLHSKDILTGDKMLVKNGEKRKVEVTPKDKEKELIIHEDTDIDSIKAKITETEVEAPIKKDSVLSQIEYVDTSDKLGYVTEKGNKVDIQAKEDISEKEEFSLFGSKKDKEKVSAKEDKEGKKDTKKEDNKKEDNGFFSKWFG